MNYCTYCDKKFKNLDNHLNLEKHKSNISKELIKKIPQGKENKGNNLCPLCKVRVGNLYRHQFSALHRHNVLKNSVPPRKHDLDEFRTHFQMCPEVRQINIMKDKKEEDPFWITAKEELNINDFNKLRRSIYENQKPRGRSRIKPRRKTRTKPRRRPGRS